MVRAGVPQLLKGERPVGHTEEISVVPELLLGHLDAGSFS